MGILNKLESSPFGLKGQKPAQREGASKLSTLHNQSSLNNNPAINIPSSVLDPDVAARKRYLDNLPK